MLKVLLGCLSALVAVSSAEAVVFKPTECPGANQFVHAGKNYLWSLSLPAMQASDWVLEVVSGPGNDSELTSMNDQTKLEVHIIPSFDRRGVTGLTCQYTLSDQTVLNVYAKHIDSLDNCLADEGHTGNFTMKNVITTNNSIWHRFWGSAEQVSFDGAHCSTSADFASECNWSEAMRSNRYGVLHFCNGTGVPIF